MQAFYKSQEFFILSKFCQWPNVNKIIIFTRGRSQSMQTEEREVGVIKMSTQVNKPHQINCLQGGRQGSKNPKILSMQNVNDPKTKSTHFWGLSLGVVHILRRQDFGIFRPLPPSLQTVYLVRLIYLCRHLETPYLPLLCLCRLWTTHYE